MNCELCGQKQAVYDADIEGTSMKVCADCSRFGSNKRGANVRVVVKQKRFEEQSPEYVFVEGYGRLVKNAREKIGLKQDEMAKRLNERESLLHQIESEHLKPSVALAKKLERELKIKIIEEIKSGENSESSNSSHSSNHAKSSMSFQNRKISDGRTLGDFIKHKNK
ncbi:MAG: helix-turn-helix domain-containing protein [Candidatus Woesearchaeota archaeon]